MQRLSLVVTVGILLVAGAAEALPRPTGRIGVFGGAVPPKKCVPTWTTVENLLPDGQTRASAAKVLVTTSNVFVVGTAWTSDTTSSWVVRRSKEGDAWVTVDDFFWSAGVSAHPDAIARSGDDLFVAGGANVVGSQAGPWLVRTSPDGDAWSTVDQVEDAEAPSATAHAAVADASGAMLVGGARYDSASGQYRWTVRSTSNQGASWTTDDDDAPTVGATGVYGLALDPGSGDVYAAGYDWDGSQYRWKVRRRAGGAWSTVDSFTLAASPSLAINGSVPTAVAVGRDGDVFVAGSGFDTDGHMHWLVRKSTDSGASWTTVDDPFGTAQRCAARAMVYETTTRALYVVGRCHDGTSYRWVTRLSTDEGASWTTADELTLAPGEDSWASGVDASSNGRVFVVGAAKSADGTLRWIARRRLCK